MIPKISKVMKSFEIEFIVIVLFDELVLMLFASLVDNGLLKELSWI